MAHCEIKRKKTWIFDGRAYSATWFHKVMKKRILTAENEKENLESRQVPI